MIGSALAALMFAAAPGEEAIGSVDGPFLWVDARASAEVTQFENSTRTPLPQQYASGASVLGQGQLFGGWGLRVFGRRLALTAAFTGTGVVTDPYWLEFRGPRFDASPLLLSSALALPVDRVVLVPVLGVTLPTRAFFNSDPILALQPQLRVRSGFESLLVGGAVFVNLPVVTKWGHFDEVSALRRCPPQETRCRMPVGRELWRVGVSTQAEYWLLPRLSVGARLGAEVREEDLGQFVVSSSSPEGRVTIPRWSTLEAGAHAMLTWGFFDRFGLTLEGGLLLHRHESADFGVITSTSWDASLAIWFRTDARLQRMWLDR